MYYVYILKSINFPDQTYVGFTKNLTQRLQAHNAGNSIYTAKYKPLGILFNSFFLARKLFF